MDRQHRKALKKQAKRSLKAHYLIFIAACVFAAFLAAEFRGSLSVTQAQSAPAAETSAAAQRSVDLQDIWRDLAGGRLEEGAALSQELKEQELRDAPDTDGVLGRSRGVLASLVNGVSSGSILVTIAAAAASLLGSDSLGGLCLVAGSALVFVAIWFLLQNVFPVIVRRIFLEGRLYPDVPFHRFAYLLHIKKWVRACWIMLVRRVYLGLWSLTVVGGVIKRYSYFLVPYITAENPSMTAREAIGLSRRMMDGHKWECFWLELSFFGWWVLGTLTLGLSNAFYANAYQTAAFTEYYAHLRALAKEKNLPGAQLLNDVYLYERPDEALIREKYADVVAVMAEPPVALQAPTGFKAALAKYFGVVAFPTAEERRYEQDQARRLRMQQLFGDVEGREYPARLYPIPEENKRLLIDSLYYVRHYPLSSLVVLFIGFSFIGWLWEVGLHLITAGTFVNRGSLHGPWLPIYGAGAVLILVLLNRLRTKPLALFLAAVALSGAVEFGTSYVMERLTGMRWWDYSGYFLNIDGRICAEGLLVFGLGGMAVVYLLAPLVDNALERVNQRALKAVCAALAVLFVADAVYSQFVPNAGEGITDDAATAAVEMAQTDAADA